MGYYQHHHYSLIQSIVSICYLLCVWPFLGIWNISANKREQDPCSALGNMYSMSKGDNYYGNEINIFMELLGTTDFRLQNFTIIFCVFSVHSDLNYTFCSAMLAPCYRGKGIVTPKAHFPVHLCKTHRNYNSACFCRGSQSTHQAFRLPDCPCPKDHTLS